MAFQKVRPKRGVAARPRPDCRIGVRMIGSADKRRPAAIVQMSEAFLKEAGAKEGSLVEVYLGTGRDKGKIRLEFGSVGSVRVRKEADTAAMLAIISSAIPVPDVAEAIPSVTIEPRIVDGQVEIKLPWDVD